MPLIYMPIPRTKNQKGTSLLELLVALSLFAMIILSATSIFKAVIDGQRNSISAQNVQESLRYALEKFNREMRMAQISNTDCQAFISPAGSAQYKVFNTDDDRTKLYFKNKDGKCVSYYLDNNRLKVNLQGAGYGGATASNYITPPEVIISRLIVYVKDDLIGAFHSQQPSVTLSIRAKAAGLAIHSQAVDMQVTVSSRYYE